MNTVYERIEKIFLDYGADINDEEAIRNIESLQYIAIFVEIENEFEITIPDEFLDYNIFIDKEKFINVIKSLVEIKDELSRYQITEKSS